MLAGRTLPPFDAGDTDPAPTVDAHVGRDTGTELSPDADVLDSGQDAEVPPATDASGGGPPQVDASLPEAGQDAGLPADSGQSHACTGVSDTLSASEKLPAGSIRCSPNGRFSFGVSASGVLELRDGQTVIWWRGSCCGTYLHMQSDGNLVVYDASIKPVFASNTSGHAGAVMIVKNEGTAVVWDNGVAIWSTSAP